MDRCIAIGILLVCTSLGLAADGGGRLRPVPFTDVHIEDAFWGPRIRTNRTSTLAACLKQCEDTGRISNFSKAAGKIPGKYEGRFYNDSDVYKVLEGAAYCLAQDRDPQLEARIDAIIDEIAAAQQPDGYINAYYTVMEPDKRWTNLCVMHELYCAGHMFEAAVAYAQATGKTKFLDVARRMADHIDGIFGPGKRTGWPGHQEIELALVKLYRYTGEERYARLAQYFIDVRGTTQLENFEHPEYMQAHKPIREQTDVVGHAVRALYMYSGVADVAALTGDPSLFATMDTIWHNIVDKKMYITGGVGARHAGEAFGDPYELPNDTAYCETCAAIGLALWNYRLNLLHGDGRYFDVVERAIYNGILSGVSLEGDRFFYVNPLSSNGKHHRQPWFGTACCPTNIVRFVPSIPGYVYATDDEGIWVNLYVQSTAKASIPSGPVKLTQKTDYPWSGDVSITVEPAQPAEFTLSLRIPQWWCSSPAVKVAGRPLHDMVLDKGYVRIRREWKPGDTVELSLSMPVQRMQAHPQVTANVGRVALQRGPIVYCLEAVDNGGRVADLVLPRDAKLAAEKVADLLGGVVVIRAQALRVDVPSWEGRLYQPLPSAKPAQLTAVPYAVWDHREAGQMMVWIPEAVGLAATQPAAESVPKK
ncbi:MAG TPA: glycoside hydrolase family 127 protein [Phycisphaerae bacterium]|nr:glycoside hydrolase family 127 protein [Phycisphaerae bacterium]HOJ72447.1 glycoside hydrolase family 127 protein [Phycisphaerae bacterium]HOM49891.1 glycoside hydrolase family 127 protein [Phycisphaerae bacterium]HOQ84695.1 glycoside hydrolase family 127 protein [Phycisphaerae bacterium]HPP26319.1 glycoside hydrolase family 127 protein [Phycisphaerae bacterium]